MSQNIPSKRTRWWAGLLLFFIGAPMAYSDDPSLLVGHWLGDSGRIYYVQYDGRSLTLTTQDGSKTMIYGGVYQPRTESKTLGSASLGTGSTHHPDEIAAMLSGVPQAVRDELVHARKYELRKELKVLGAEEMVLSHIVDRVDWQNTPSPQITELIPGAASHTEKLTRVIDYTVDAIRITTDFAPFLVAQELPVGQFFTVEVSFLKPPIHRTLWAIVATSSGDPIRVPIKRAAPTPEEEVAGTATYRSDPIWLGSYRSVPSNSLEASNVEANPGDLITARFEDVATGAVAVSNQKRIAIRKYAEGPLLNRVHFEEFFIVEATFPRGKQEHSEYIWVNLSADSGYRESVRLRETGSSGPFVTYHSEQMNLWAGPLPHVTWFFGLTTPFYRYSHGRWSAWKEFNAYYGNYQGKKYVELLSFEYDQLSTKVIVHGQHYAHLAAQAREGLETARQMYSEDLRELDALAAYAAGAPWILQSAQAVDGEPITPERLERNRQAIEDKIRIVENALALMADAKWDSERHGDAVRYAIAEKFAELLILDPSEFGKVYTETSGLDMSEAESSARIAAIASGREYQRRVDLDVIEQAMKLSMETISSAGFSQLYALFHGTDVYGNPLAWYERLRSGAELLVGGYAIHKLGQIRRVATTPIGPRAAGQIPDRLTPLRPIDALSVPGSRTVPHPVITRQLKRSGFSEPIAAELGKLPPRNLRRALRMDGPEFDRFLDRSFKNYDGGPLSQRELARRKVEYETSFVDHDRFAMSLAPVLGDDAVSLAKQAGFLSEFGIGTEEAIVRHGFNKAMQPEQLMEVTGLGPGQVRRVLGDVLGDLNVSKGRRGALIDDYMSGRTSEKMRALSAEMPTQRFTRLGKINDDFINTQSLDANDLLDTIPPSAIIEKPTRGAKSPPVDRVNMNAAAEGPTFQNNPAGNPALSSSKNGAASTGLSPLGSNRLNQVRDARNRARRPGVDFNDGETRVDVGRQSASQDLGSSNPESPTSAERATGLPDPDRPATMRLLNEPANATPEQQIKTLPPELTDDAVMNLRFGPDDLVYGVAAKGSLARLRRQAGGRTLNDIPKPMSETWQRFTTRVLDDAADSGRQVHFDLTYVVDLDNVLAGIGRHADLITGVELRHIRDIWPDFRVKPKFYRAGQEVAPPW